MGDTVLTVLLGDHAPPMFRVVLGECRVTVGIVDQFAIMLVFTRSMRGCSKLTTVRVPFGGLARPYRLAGCKPPRK
ncbi:MULTISPECIES: hypothetical protein [Rhizobium]|uniref:hypothetical protein n=1 Tax=Rhizobium phaseoli TaxID=396 RepID=UPI00019031EB|nr:hypothetical protein [Rhizobium phaseoli]